MKILTRTYCYLVSATTLGAMHIASANSVTVYDFDDGTLQGWTKGAPVVPFAGDLFVDNTGGAPGG